jgi:hypothetical protein
LAIVPVTLIRTVSPLRRSPSRQEVSLDLTFFRDKDKALLRQLLLCQSETYREHLSCHLDLLSNFFNFFSSRQITAAAEMQLLVAKPQQNTPQRD